MNLKKADTGTVVPVVRADSTVPVSALKQVSASSGGGLRVMAKTTEEWNADTSYIPSKNAIIVYTDYVEGKYPAIKIADGKAYLIDQPFVEIPERADIIDHITNLAIHVSSVDRTLWNDKVSASIDGETLVFV